MIPSTFTLTGARTVTYDDGVRALILDGNHHQPPRAFGVCTIPGHTQPVSVTVFLGDDDMAQTIVRALTEGEGE